MEYVLDKHEKALLRAAEKNVSKWKRILHLDPLWHIGLSITDAEEMGGALARVDTSNAEYYVAEIEVSSTLLVADDKQFADAINELVCHELVHLVMIDFFRTAQLAAGDRQDMQDELRYKYEQFTSRFHRAFVALDMAAEKAASKAVSPISESEKTLTTDDGKEKKE
jgi:hypothetical protein